jgi:hypothetical protein
VISVMNASPHEWGVMKVLCRQVGLSDLDMVADLLARGIPGRSRAFWVWALRRLTDHATPRGFPKYGYLLESNGRVVGAVLVIATFAKHGDLMSTRCNLSSWYVDPPFRPFASLLIQRVLKHKPATYLNTSPAKYTWATVEAQGFTRYCDGVVVAVPMLAEPVAGIRLTVVGPNGWVDERLCGHKQKLLRDHAALGSISLCCSTKDGAHPFVLTRRWLRGLLPCAQLTYCHDVNELIQYAGPIGRLLMRRGMTSLMINANGPIPGMIGRYFKNVMPKYFLGQTPPSLTDLSYTEIPMFGI